MREATGQNENTNTPILLSRSECQVCHKPNDFKVCDKCFSGMEFTVTRYYADQIEYDFKETQTVAQRTGSLLAAATY